MNDNKVPKELIDKCEKTRKGGQKKAKILTDNDIMKYEIASELGLLDKVSEGGWAGLTAKEAGRIGGLLTSRKKQKKKIMEDQNKEDGSI